VKLFRALWLVIVTTVRYVWAAARDARDQHRLERQLDTILRPPRDREMN